MPYCSHFRYTKPACPEPGSVFRIIWIHTAEERFHKYVCHFLADCHNPYLFEWTVVKIYFFRNEGFSAVVHESESTAAVEMPTLTDTFQLSTKPGDRKEHQCLLEELPGGKAQPFSSAQNKWIWQKNWKSVNRTTVSRSGFHHDSLCQAQSIILRVQRDLFFAWQRMYGMSWKQSQDLWKIMQLVLMYMNGTCRDHWPKVWCHPGFDLKKGFLYLA